MGALSPGGQLHLEDCEALNDAQDDGRASFTFSDNGQLRSAHLADYCVKLSPSGASVTDCDSAGTVLSAAVPEWDATAAMVVKDLASLLAAATSRQRELLAELQAALPTLESCSLSFANNLTASLSLAGAASGHAFANSEDPAMQAITMIDASVSFDMSAVRN